MLSLFLKGHGRFWNGKKHGYWSLIVNGSGAPNWGRSSLPRLPDVPQRLTTPTRQPNWQPFAMTSEPHHCLSTYHGAFCRRRRWPDSIDRAEDPNDVIKRLAFPQRRMTRRSGDGLRV